MALEKRATSWSEPISQDEVRRRAAGRRRYNRQRQLRARERQRAELTALVRTGRSGTERGVQATLAEAFDVSCSTISRDLRRIFADVRAGRQRGLHELLAASLGEQIARGPCPVCGRAFG
jgi:hypothetical protein